MKLNQCLPNIIKGMDLKKGSIVLLNFWGENEDLATLDEIAIEVGKLGCFPIKWQYAQNYLKDYYDQVSRENLEFSSRFFDIFDTVDAIIDICFYIPPKPHVDFNRENISFYANYMQQLFGKLMTKEKFVQIKLPTKSLADAYRLDFNLLHESLCNAYLVDYEKLKERTSEIISKLQHNNTVKIYSGDNILSCDIHNREWFKDDGDGDIPSGEVYIAPIEESVQGTIVIPLVIHNGLKYHNVILGFIGGKLHHCSEEELLQFIMSHPGDKDIFAEFGIGLNEQVNEIIGYPALDEKCIDTVHIALGMNQMFGGKNSSPFHMDFILRPDRIEMDGIIIYENSELII